VGKRLKLSMAGNDANIHRVIQTFGKDVNRYLFDVGIPDDVATSEEAVTCIFFALSADDSLTYGSEGYALSIDEQITIEAQTDTGLFWGSRTLLQLLEKGPGIELPGMKIIDTPTYGYRGLLMDVARHFHSIDFHLETIRRVAGYKLNHYMIHFSDHESFTLPSERYPKLPTPGRHYTRGEIDQLVQTAREYYVTLVPSIDVPGHAGALVGGIPELYFDDNPRAIDITKEQTYVTLCNLFDEMMDLIPGPWWHLGADEVRYPDVSETKNQGYRQRLGEIGVERGDQLLNYFINRMYTFFEKEGRKMLVWEGFDPTGAPRVNKDIIVCPFDVKFDGRMPTDYMNAGYRILNTSWSPLYVADRLYMTTPEIMARWKPTMFGAGRSPQPFHYWQKLGEEEVTKEIIGAQMCSWANEEKAEWGLLFGDMPGYPEYGRPGPRIQIFSDRIWRGGEADRIDLLEMVGEAYC